MSFQVRLCFSLLALLLASATLALGKEDPELKQCKQQCKAQEQFGREKRELCEQRCEEYYRQKRGGGSGNDDDEEVFWNRESPIERLRECSRQCQRQRGAQAQQCQQRCQAEYEKEKEQYEGGGERGSEENPSDPQREYQQCRETCRRQAKHGSTQECLQRCEERRRERERGRDSYEGRERGEEEEEEEGREQEFRGGNPYVFEDRHFTTELQSQHGRIRILQKFTERSKLLKGIENYRVTILEMEPQTFVVPNHWDAEALFFVAKGRGTVSMVRQNRRESFSIREGDIVRIRAGTTTYLINKDNNQKLVLAKLLQPVSTPGEFEVFFGAGGRNPESFYRAFSDEILEAAFNVRRDRLHRIFGQQSQGLIIKASQEQLRALSHHEEGGVWPFGGESKGSINLFQQHPTHQNQYGQHFVVDSSHFRPLHDLDVSICFSNITQGAMMAPHYNSKATKIAVVVEGEGKMEIACPHVSQSTQGGRGTRWRKEQGTQGSPSYQRVASRLTRGTVVVVPAGHPFVAVASKNQNLKLLCFEVNARDNEKYALAGRRNVINQIEREAKELAFGVPAREVEEVFSSQEDEFLFRGPRQQQGRAEE